MIIGRYLAGEGKVDTRDAVLLGGLFDEAGCRFFDESDNFFDLIKAKDENSIDYNKFIFTYSVLRKLNLIEEEENLHQQPDYKNIFTMQKYDIIKALINNNIEEDGYLDVMKTSEIFDEWSNYALKSKEYLNNTITIPTLNQKTGETDIKTLNELKELGVESTYYDNSLYRLTRLLT